MLDTAHIPTNNGDLVLNVQMILSIYEAVVCNKPALSKYITFGKLQTKEASIVRVTVGDKISNIIGSSKNDNRCIFVGGGIMQTQIADNSTIIDHKTNFTGLSESNNEFDKRGKMIYGIITFLLEVLIRK